MASQMANSDIAAASTAPLPPPQIVFDSISIWWIAWCSTWTTCLVAGMVFLYYKRHVPSVRVRGLTLTFCGVTLLHLYWGICQLSWMIGPILPEMTEFWVMSIYLPCGLACFQAANCQLLHVAKLQEKYSNGNVLEHAVRRNSVLNATSWYKKTISRFKQTDSRVRMLIYISIGMVFQVLMTVFIFCISRKFHPGWGLPGTEAPGEPMQRKLAMGRGWEWVPSIGWQVFWAWIFAPIVLLKARNIHDTHGWRVQTIACCIAGLPAAPLWLVALYVPAMAPVNKYWIPPQWICVSIMIIEICTIFIPCWMARKHQNLHHESLAAIALWESQKLGSVSDASTVASTLVGSDGDLGRRPSQATLVDYKKMPSSPKTDINRPAVMFTMDSLEQCLRLNPEPLQRFAALRDFSGENISFLTSVNQWRREWTTQRRISRDFTSEEGATLRRKFFNQALVIYASNVSLIYASFPINLSSRDYKVLEHLFGSAARIIYGKRDSFDSAATLFSSGSPDEKTVEISTAEVSAVPDPTAEAGGESVWYWGDIPEAFDIRIFDSAEKSIKQLVLMDTWPKFVRSGYADSDHKNKKDWKKFFGKLAPLGCEKV